MNTMIDPLFDLTGRVVVVTGGLGQLGRAFTAALAERGARVAVLDTRAEPQQNPDIMSLACDVTRKTDLLACLGEIRGQWGEPHGLINNAALDSPPGAPAAENGPFESYPEESWDRVMEVNAKGVFLCCQVFGGAMAEAGRGSIVNVGSTYGVGSPNQTIYEFRRRSGEQFYKPVAYSASKSALYNLTRYLATYWARKGVRVNIVTFAGVAGAQPREFLDAYLPLVPMGRMAQPADYVGGIIYLLADASSYMTGSELVIDGGWTAW
jgi:NAD(P)-dependent dehydrogenase (short-subunit alcohol dehydrogenase family)